MRFKLLRQKTRSAGRCKRWLKQHLKASYEPLLKEPWVLDVDTTVKVLYGHQQDAVVGYNPTKPGRPSHAYQCAFNWSVTNSQVICFQDRLSRQKSTLKPYSCRSRP